jgi:hypothetical protein
MFNKEDLERIDPRVPDDLDERSKEFWDYVGERFTAVSGRLKKIYLESSGVTGKRHLEMMKISDPRQYETVKLALDSGAELVEAEDPELVLESLSWMGKMQDLVARGAGGEDLSSLIETVGGFLQESMRERDAFVAEKVSSTLLEGEVGALMFEGSRRLEFASDIRVVTTCPFEPRDYLERWLATLRVRDQPKPSETGKDEAGNEEQ